MPGDNSSLLTISEAAQILNCSGKTIRRQISAGNLQAVRLGHNGRLIRIIRSHLINMLKPATPGTDDIDRFISHRTVTP